MLHFHLYIFSIASLQSVHAMHTTPVAPLPQTNFETMTRCCLKYVSCGDSSFNDRDGPSLVV